MKTTLTALAVLATLNLSPALPAPPSGNQDTVEQPVVFHWSHYAPDDWSAAQRQEFTDLSRLMNSHMTTHYSELSTVSSYQGTAAFHFFNVSPSFEKRLELQIVLAKDEGWRSLSSRWKELGTDRFGDESFALLFTVAGGRPSGTQAQGSFRVVWPSGMQAQRPFRIVWHARTDVARSLRAARFAREVAAHLRAGYPEVNLWVLSPRIDYPGSFYWLFDYSSALDFDRVQQRLLDDDAYVELFDRAAGLFDSIEHEALDLLR